MISLGMPKGGRFFFALGRLATAPSNLKAPKGGYPAYALPRALCLSTELVTRQLPRPCPRDGVSRIAVTEGASLLSP